MKYIKTKRGAELGVERRGKSVLLTAGGEVFLMLSGDDVMELCRALVYCAVELDDFEIGDLLLPQPESE